MPAAPLPMDEDARLSALLDLGVMDTPRDDEFDDLVMVAARACGVPIALITLLDDERQWFKANVGLEGTTQTPRDLAFCGYTICADDLLEVEDARLDPRFADNALVTGPPHIRFYAGAPLRVGEGSALGALCVIDTAPRQLNAMQRELLRALGKVAAKSLQHRRIAQSQCQLAQDLQVSEARLRRLYEATPAMLHSIDESGVVRMVSDTWLARLGYTREEVIGRSVTDFGNEESRERSLRFGIPRLFANGASSAVEYQLVRKDGSVMDVEVSAIVDAAGPRSLSVVEDVTQRRQAERALQAENRRLSSIIESTGLGTWEWNVRTDEVHVNEHWARAIGWTVAELPPLSFATWKERMHPDDRAAAVAAMEGHLSGYTQRYEFEFRLRHRAGHYVWLLDIGSVISRGADGTPEWMFGTRQDISVRKRQEDALRKSEEFLERTGRTAGVGGWELDLVSNELHWSAETYRIVGAPPEYRPTLESAIGLYAPVSRPVIRAAFERAIATGEGWDLELQFVRRDGRPIWVRSVGTAAVARGVPVRLSGAFQDITDRVAERQALQQANEHVRLATDSGGIGIWQRDFIAGRSSWNDQVYRLFGLAPQCGGDSMPLWQERLYPEDRAAVVRAVQDAVTGAAPYDLEYRIVWNDGSVRHLRAAARVIRDAEGQPVRMVGVCWDVTDSRRLAAELTRQAERQAEASERERALFRSSPDVLTVIHVDTEDDAPRYRYAAVSPALLPLTGWLPEALIGQRPEDCLPFDVACLLLAEYRACVEGNRVTTYAVTLDTPRGKRDFEGSLAPIRHKATGQVIRLTGAMRDVTERNRLITAEHHGQKMEAIGRLAAGVAHDFNNILQSISSSLEMVQDELTPGTLAHDLTTIGLRSANRGSYLTHHLLSYARKQMLRPEVIELPELLSDMAKLLQRTLGPNIAVTVRTDPSAGTLRVDPAQIQTALLNLAINASHAMANGGALLIESRASLRDGKPWVTIEVTDTGTGMDEATLARATEPFFTTKGLNGSGLGLSMVQGFAEQSGGRMTIDSALGRGTMVALHLPAAETAAVDTAPPVAAPARPERTTTVLLVDDDPDVLVTTGAFLEKAGFSILRASGSDQALSLVAAGASIDALVTDYAMPGMNGADLVSELRTVQPNLPSIIISGFADLMQVEMADGGRLITLHKPFQRDLLVRSLGCVLCWTGQIAVSVWHQQPRQPPSAAPPLPFTNAGTSQRR